MQIPRVLRVALPLLIVYLLLGTLYRAGLWLYFDSASQPLAANLVRKALVLGLRFDLRLGLLLILPLLLLGWMRWINPFRGSRARMVWTAAYAVAWAVLILFYIFDGGYYAYLNERLNAAILVFVDDAQASRDMVWQSYPVVWITLVWLALTAALTALTHWLLKKAAKYPGWSAMPSRWLGFGRGLAWTVALFVLVAAGLMGRFSQYPLRWSDAQFSAAPFASALPMNPVLFFWDTLDFKAEGYDLAKVKDAYPRMAKFYGVDQPDPEKLNFARVVAPRKGSFDKPYNVVAVYLESFSAYNSSLFGGKLGVTPNFDEIAKQGVLFDRYFTPAVGTARSVFAGLTGIADVGLKNTSSRNPRAVSQQLIINQFSDYEKYYFIGGSTTWANVRGLLQTNIDGIRIHEEGSFTSPTNDVWGITDKSLFWEANKVLRDQKKPFFAVIQTAGGHRPYTIDRGDAGFEFKHLTAEQMRGTGLTEEDQYNSYRYLDWSIGEFIKMARKEAYFDNTVFVFYGDHGISGDVRNVMPPAWTDMKLSGLHVPLLIYAPKLLQPQRISKIASELDLMPTIAGLFNRPYLNTTMGRDLLDPRFDGERDVFTIWHRPGPEIGVINKDYYFTMYADGTHAHLGKHESSDAKHDWSGDVPEVAARMRNRALDLYHTARYMTVNNPRSKKP